MRKGILIEISIILIVVIGIWGYQSYSENKTTTMQKVYASLWKEENIIPQIEIRTNEEETMLLTDEKEIKSLIETLEKLTLKKNDEIPLSNEEYRVDIRITTPHKKLEDVSETSQIFLPLGEDFVGKFDVIEENYLYEHIKSIMDSSDNGN
ncbi:hypothetical protein [Sutcliffiella cohnii]|uniref:hypothetical protein n=1 Tax=Sutcliffiella cohnii TaxID=33932 RepID=UPI002E248D5B|nr:hypothetical protein [Sutcliffiella cohnii]